MSEARKDEGCGREGRILPQSCFPKTGFLVRETQNEIRYVVNINERSVKLTQNRKHQLQTQEPCTFHENDFRKTGICHENDSEEMGIIQKKGGFE